MDYYTGIGSRKTPLHIQDIMTRLADVLKGSFILRSGGADGADTAFEKNLEPIEKDIFLPWKGFNDNRSILVKQDTKAETIAEQLHPGWAWLSPGAKKLMARNVHQVLGMHLDRPSAFIICWTRNGAETFEEANNKTTGGTGLAIKVASQYKIPIYNLANSKSYWLLVNQYLEGKET